MKKIILPLFLISLFLISATKEPSRFATPEEMAKALLSAFQKNDSIRFLELYPSRDETFAAFATPWKDSSLYEHQKTWSGKYYLNNSELARRMFRETRQEVISQGIDWNAVTFTAVHISKEKNRSPGIDYLYNCWLDYNFNGRKIKLRLSDAMQTKAGWNCGLGVRVSSIDPTQEQQLELIAMMQADSARMADSIRAVEDMMRAQWQADSALHAKYLADSIQMAEEMKKAKNKKPK